MINLFFTEERLGIDKNKKNVVVSGINLRSGGTLSIFYDLLSELKYENYFSYYNIILLVHNKDYFSEYSDVATIIEYRYAKKSWLIRLFYEYIYFRRQFKQLHIYIWLSLHDISPNIICEKQYVYCHNSTPFLKPSLKVFYFSKKIFLFSLFYKYLYQINIHKNEAIIVQQNWIRNKFAEMYNLPINKIIVAKPKVDDNCHQICTYERNFPSQYKEAYKFIYPSFPRVFKNFEVLCEAFKLLPLEMQHKIQILITINGNENKYAKYIYKKYHHVSGIKFIGLIDRIALFDMYNEVDAMIFPSKLETWGLPLTEFAVTQKMILAADLPYAHETLHGYRHAMFFDPDSPQGLANLIQQVINQPAVKDGQPVDKNTIDKPYANNWKELLSLLFQQN